MKNQETIKTVAELMEPHNVLYRHVSTKPQAICMTEAQYNAVCDIAHVASAQQNAAIALIKAIDEAGCPVGAVNTALANLRTQIES